MSDYYHMKVNIENSEPIEFDYLYNSKSTFEYLLEFIAFHFPEKKICPCFQFKAYYEDKEIIDINRNWTFNSCIKKYSNFFLYNPNKKCQCLSFIKENYNRTKIDILQKFSKLLQANAEQKSNDKNNKIDEYYDLFIDIKSIKDICKGWEIKTSSKYNKEYEQLNKDNVTRIGIIGEVNKGKTFVLSKISQMKLPEKRNEGLMFKYIDNLENYHNKRLILLDSAGFEKLILKDDEKKVLLDEKIREKLYTDYFLQNYIINNTDILLFVVGIMTYFEQKLLYIIKMLLKKSKIKKEYL